MGRYIYPTMPDNPLPEFYEMVDLLDLVEINCRCSYDENGNLVECESCKQYFENKRVQSVIDVILENLDGAN